MYNRYEEEWYVPGQVWMIGVELVGLRGRTVRALHGLECLAYQKNRRADLVHGIERGIRVVEFKTVLDHDAVGQVLLYAMLLRQDWLPQGYVEPYLAGESIEADVVGLCKDLSIGYELFAQE